MKCASFWSASRGIHQHNVSQVQVQKTRSSGYEEFPVRRLERNVITHPRDFKYFRRRQRLCRSVDRSVQSAEWTRRCGKCVEWGECRARGNTKKRQTCAQGALLNTNLKKSPLALSRATRLPFLRCERGPTIRCETSLLVGPRIIAPIVADAMSSASRHSIAAKTCFVYASPSACVHISASLRARAAAADFCRSTSFIVWTRRPHAVSSPPRAVSDANNALAMHSEPPKLSTRSSVRASTPCADVATQDWTIHVGIRVETSPALCEQTPPCASCFAI